jgi:hypothetical protein
MLTESVAAQTTGDISVEVQIYNRRTLRPLQDAAVYLYQNNSTSGSGGGFYTDANGFIALEAFPLQNTTSNYLQILCNASRGRSYSQTVPLYGELQTDRIYQRSIYLEAPSSVESSQRFPH